MKLTKKQSEGLSIIINRHRAGEKYTIVSGYAGTGKSTLVKFAISALDVSEDKVAYACYTGKAAEVLRKKGNKNACTLHKLLYDSIPKKGGGFMRIKKVSLDVDIVVVDEISMVPKSMIDLLFSHRIYVIGLGDPFQLHQIDKNEAHDLLDHAHIFLDEIMRQAQESEIIRLTMDIREGKDIPYQKGKEVMVLSKEEFNSGMLLWADQVICATNNTRHSLNNQIRNLKGFSGLIQENEKVIIKRNYWGLCNEDGDALVNGTTGTIYNPIESSTRIPSFVKSNIRDMPTIVAEFIPDGGQTFGNIDFDRVFLEKETPCIDWRVSYQLGKLIPKIGDIVPRQMTYGYAITCHASQGSEWDKVLVIEESFPFDKIEHARWLYTACTRSSSKLVLVR